LIYHLKIKWAYKSTMCIDSKTSLNYYILAVIGSLIIWIRDKGTDRPDSIFILTYSTMQLLEYFIWKSIENNPKQEQCDKTNQRITSIIPIVLFLQPLIHILVRPISNVFAIPYILIILKLIFERNSNKFCSTPGPNGHLVWRRNDEFLLDNRPLESLLHLLGIFIPFFTVKPFSNVVPFFLLTTGSFIWSVINYSKTREFTTMWCIIAVFNVIIKLLF